MLGTPKGDRPRTIDLTDEAIDALRRHPHVLRSEYVFGQPDGSPAIQRVGYDALHAARKAAGVGGADMDSGATAWTPGGHTCRHIFISWLVQAGVPLLVVETHAGHANIKTTMRYARPAPSSTRNAVQRLDGWHKKVGTTPGDEAQKSGETRER